MSVASHFLLVLNSSTNIIIYSWKDKKFRTVLKCKLSASNNQNRVTSYYETVQRQQSQGDVSRGFFRMKSLLIRRKSIETINHVEKYLNQSSSLSA